VIPLRDDIDPERRPWVNLTLIGLNLAAFAYEISLGQQLDGLFQVNGLVPARVLDAETWQTVDLAHQVGPLFSHMFLHGGWLHLIGNLWFLHVFGDNVEGRLGHGRYLVFYLLCGLAAAAAQVLSAPGSFVPMIGASGAVAGVLGAYFLLFPGARVLTLVPLVILFPMLHLPALVFLGFWALMQFFRGTAELVGGATDGVAWWAHVGGFVFGLVYVGLRPTLRLPVRRRRHSVGRR